MLRQRPANSPAGIGTATAGVLGAGVVDVEQPDGHQGHGRSSSRPAAGVCAASSRWGPAPARPVAEGAAP
jgi:hypothetical protein